MLEVFEDQAVNQSVSVASCTNSRAAAIAAVSARRISGPSDTARPASCREAARSSSVQPPSGPIRRAIVSDATVRLQPRGAARPASRPGRIGEPPPTTSVFESDTGSRTSGRSARRDCWLASSAMRRHRSTRLRRRAPGPARCGWFRRARFPDTPSSVAFSIIHSKRSNLIKRGAQHQIRSGNGGASSFSSVRKTTCSLRAVSISAR